MVRTLAGLERAVGVRLLNRTTRRMALTDEGREYYERSQAILSAVEQVHASLHARKTEPGGTLHGDGVITRSLIRTSVLEQ